VFNEDLSSLNGSIKNGLNQSDSIMKPLQNVLITISDIGFSSMSSNTSGGMLRYFDPSVHLMINNNVFYNGYSKEQGGSLFFQTKSKISILNCSFQSNNATLDGGAAFFDVDGGFEIKNSTFFNSSSSRGGTLFIMTDEANISESWFENSNSSSDGGSIYFSKDNGLMYSIYNCFFGTTSSLNDGGAIFISQIGHYSSMIVECTFYSCSSSSNGGAVYITSGSGGITVNIFRVCFCKCVTYSINGAGVAIYLVSEAVTHLISVKETSIGQCGLIGKGIGTIHTYRGQQYFAANNISNCESKSGVAGNHLTYYSSSFSFINIIRCNSTENVYFKTEAQQSVDFLYCNILNNNATGYIMGIWAYQDQFSLKYGIFIENIKNLIRLYYQNQKMKNCYIVQENPNLGMSQDLCYITASTAILTPTYQITHYSTFFCKTPNDLGSLEIPCQTLGIQDCQSIPPIPSTCYLPSNNGELNLISTSRVIHQLLISGFVISF